MNTTTLAAGNLNTVADNIKANVQIFGATGLGILGMCFVLYVAAKFHFSPVKILGMVAGVILAAVVFYQIAPLIGLAKSSGGQITGVNGGGY